MSVDEKELYKHFWELLNLENSKTISSPSEVKFQHLLPEAEKIIMENREKAFLENIDCKKGCGYCCILNIPVLSPESDNIYHFIKSNFSDQQLNIIKQKIDSYGFQIKNLDDEERIVCRKPCIFLSDEESCSIYPVRPILCRSVTSTSASKCKQALESVVMGDENTVLMNSFIKDLYKNLFLAVSDFLSSRNLPDKSVEITQAVKKSLNSEQI
ncbi:YkgJ family cysteine cluster protein [Flexistipes sinusarabici]|uniref:YkgJ family cysteine cluster protein n=1 Tax=Flexistipes sinusarabici TaxID=2352 RepID=UPI0023558B35|nr:YkgJ family cysteine cluster protein [Flexistipes sinusarabici]